MNNYRLLVEDLYRRLIEEATSAKAESTEHRGSESQLFFEGKELGLYVAVTTFRDQIESWQLEIDPDLVDIDLESALLGNKAKD